MLTSRSRKWFPLAALAVVGLAAYWALSFGTLPPADFTFANGTEIKSLDPAIAYGQPEGRIVQALFEGLTNNDPKTLQATPGVAERWEVSPDGLVYTFHLRGDARWSDGRPVTAHDFAWSYRRLLDPLTAGEYANQLWYVRNAKKYCTARVEAGDAVEVELNEQPEGALPFARGIVLRGELLRIETTADGADSKPSENGAPGREGVKVFVVRIDGRERRFVAGDAIADAEACKQVLLDFTQVGVEAVNDRTLRLTLENPTPYFLDLTGFYTLAPSPRWTVETFGYPAWTRPEHVVGNGPFRLQSRRIRDRLRLVKSETYWDRDHVRLNVVDALAVESPSTALNLYLTGAVDWITTVPPTVAPDLIAAKRDDFVPTPEMTTYFYRLNVTRPPLDNPLVRRALARAVDKRGIIDTVTRSGELPAESLVPPGMPGYEPAVGGGYDVDEARRLLAEAGYPGGRGLPKLTIMYNTDEGHQAIAEYIQDQWKRNLGVDVELQNQEWGAFMSSVSRLEYSISRAGWIGDYADPQTFLGMFTSSSTNNTTGYKSPEYDALLDRAASELDPAKRLRIMHDAEALLLDAAPLIPIYFRVSKNMVRPHVRGIHANVRDLHPLRSIWVEQSGSATSETELRDHPTQDEKSAADHPADATDPPAH